MREHGVLNRILHIYEDVTRKLKSEGEFPVKTLAGAAGIIRQFIEDYHEKLEQDYLFPRYEKAGVLVELVATLRSQHDAGRRLTDETVRLSTNQRLKNPEDRKKLINCVEQFIHMYRPHEAREDTVLFPALRSIISSEDLDSLGEEFEEKEHQLFGSRGFERIVEKVAVLEESVDRFDLSKFTPILDD